MSSKSPSKKPSFFSQVTWRSLLFGFFMAIIMCTVNSYLTLKAGIVEEGPIISALIFIAIFSAMKQRVTAVEAVIVATMGSAGGSWGFVANIYAAYHLVGIQLTVVQMISLSFCTGFMGILMAVPFYQLFVVKETLPWPVGQVCADVITTTVDDKNSRQGLVILIFAIIFFAYIMSQGLGKVSDTLKLTAIGATGIGLLLSPFIISAGYLVGVRVGFGFLVAAIILVILAPHTPDPAKPQAFFYPGVAFLLTSGLTAVALKWRTVVAALKSLKNLSANNDSDAIMSSRWLLVLMIVSVLAIVTVLKVFFDIPIYLGLILALLGPTLLNLIAVRAMGETTFNPIRVMGVLLQGVTAAAGGSSAFANLGGAGVVAGGINQTGIACQDLYTGRQIGVKPRLQVICQFAVLPVICVVSVLVFLVMVKAYDINEMAAPVAKVWAVTAQLFSGGQLPANVVPVMVGFGLAGIVLAFIDSLKFKAKKYLPHPTGIGIGLILAISGSLAFFFGAVLFWALGKYFRIKETTLNSIAAAGILGEGLGGVIAGIINSFFLNK